MLARPWPIVILAVLHILGPIGNLFLSAWVQKLPVNEYFFTLIHTSSAWGLIDFFVLLPLAGIALYLCKKWSYPVFLIIAGTTVYSNFQTYQQFSELFTFGMFLATFFLDAVFVGYFLIPAVRAPYVDPRLRWWESKPRFVVRIRTLIFIGQNKFNGVIMDISQGGVFIKTPRTLDSQEPVRLLFSIFGKEFNVNGQIVYRRQGQMPGFGIRFLHTTKTKRAIKRFVKGLESMGINTRTHFDWKSDLITWVADFVTTGKGLIPKVPAK